jgi:DNA-directed RNA polymerase subunit omega
MAHKATLMDPRMEQLLERVDSKFTLVTLAAMRAREINDYYNQLGEGLGKIVPPQVTSVSRKPLSIALEEIEADKIEAVPLPPELTAEEIAAAEAEIAAALLAVKEADAESAPKA